MATTKLSELMIDMETGDACMEDAYIASAKGQINVSHAIFEAAYKNSELPDDGQFVCYVESAQEGIPTETKKASGVACAAVGKELGAYLDAVVATAKKVKNSAEKDLKTMIVIGKKVGVAMSENFEKDFAKPLGESICSDGKLTLNTDGKFIKGKDAYKIAKAYTNGCVKALSAFGISIDIPEAVKDFTGCECGSGTVSSLKQVDTKIKESGSAFKTGDGSTTGTVKPKDITDVALAIYSCANVADAVIKAVSTSAKKEAMANINSFCGDKLGNSHHSINGDIQGYMNNLEKIGNTIASGFTDSAYALMETISKK